MPLYNVEVSRWYKSRHVHTRVVEADTPEAAEAWVDRELQNGEFDPSDNYEEQVTGYDDAGAWEVDAQFVREAIAGPADVKVGDAENSENAGEEPGKGYTDQG